MVLIKSEKDELDRLTREIKECERAIEYFDALESEYVALDGRDDFAKWWNIRRETLMCDRACVLIAAAERIEAEEESHGTDA